ncbi:MAG: hypothetical protein IJL07_08995 [Lachnospiraceae bacterium]|nr:hypothetical protein [Lachnospiraceae bacterium]
MIGEGQEKIKSFFSEVIPEVEKIREIAEKFDIKQGLRIYIGDNDYFSIEGSGLEGWSVTNFGKETTLKYEHTEVLKTNGGDAGEN